MYLERAFVNRRPDRRRPPPCAAFPIVLPGGMRIDAERRRQPERRREERLSGLQLFEDVPADIVGKLLTSCPVREFERETVVLVPGQPNENIFLLLSGRLRIHLDALDSGNSFHVETGGCVGELSLIDSKPVSAYVVAEPQSRLLIIDQQHFWSHVLPHPGVARNLLRVLSERMRRNNDAILEGFKQQLVLEHIQREIKLAREIQASMLPKQLPPARPNMRVDVFAEMEPARQVGGDLYDYFYTPDEKLCFLVGDVSDKGMPAALFMARTVDIVRVVSRLLRSADGGVCAPDEIIACVNRDLCQNNASFMFVTMFFGVLDPTSGELYYCNAGHNVPYLVGGKRTPRELGGSKGNPLGVKLDSHYGTHRAVLKHDEMLFVFSDGITEAMAGDDSFFGERRLESVLLASRATTPRALVGDVIAAVKDFVGESSQSDDITALALRVDRTA